MNILKGERFTQSRGAATFNKTRHLVPKQPALSCKDAHENWAQIPCRRESDSDTRERSQKWKLMKLRYLYFVKVLCFLGPIHYSDSAIALVRNCPIKIAYSGKFRFKKFSLESWYHLRSNQIQRKSLETSNSGLIFMSLNWLLGQNHRTWALVQHVRSLKNSNFFYII